MLAGAGGVAGLLVGIGVSWAVSALGYWPTVIAWDTVVVAFAFSVTVGIFFGLYPAVRAARLEPIQALHAE